MKCESECGKLAIRQIGKPKSGSWELESTGAEQDFTEVVVMSEDVLKFKCQVRHNLIRIR